MLNALTQEQFLTYLPLLISIIPIVYFIFQRHKLVERHFLILLVGLLLLFFGRVFDVTATIKSLDTVFLIGKEHPLHDLCKNLICRTFGLGLFAWGIITEVIFMQKSKQELKHKAHQMSVINEIANIVSASLEIEETFRAIAQAMHKILEFDHATIALIEPPAYTTYRLFSMDEVVQKKGITTSKKTSFPVKGSQIEVLARDRKPVVSHHTDFIKTLSDQPPIFIKEGFSTIILVPLLSPDRVIGSLHIGSTAPLRDIHETLHVFHQISGDLISAIEKSHLYNKLKEFTGKLDLLVREKTAELEKKIVQLQETQLQLIQSEKMAATSKLIAGVAHEIKNPLNSMGFTAANIKDVIMSSSTLEDVRKDSCEHVEILNSDIERLKNLVNDFMVFAKPSKIVLKARDINKILHSVVASLSEEIKNKKITVIERYDTTLSATMVEEDELYRAFLNIILNAFDAMPNGGTVTIETKRSLQEVIIEISDTGCGIPEDIEDKIFDIFFTSKEKGTGLGLSQVYRTVESLNGKISVRNRLGKGVTFTLTLPNRGKLSSA